MRKAQIPYKVSGGTSFFDRAEMEKCRLVSAVDQPQRRPGVFACRHQPQTPHRHQTLGALGELAGKYKVSLFEALFSRQPHKRDLGQGAGHPARVRPRGQRPQFRARQTLGAKAAKTFLQQWLKDIAFEKYLLKLRKTATR